MEQKVGASSNPVPGGNYAGDSQLRGRAAAAAAATYRGPKLKETLFCPRAMLGIDQLPAFVFCLLASWQDQLAFKNNTALKFLSFRTSVRVRKSLSNV